MGYYTGAGVVTGGGESYSILRTFPILGGDSFKVGQKNVYSTVRKSGVSLATAQGTHESHNLSYISGGSGSYAWIVFDANGTRTTPTYSRIGDSNLFDLTVTTETLTASTESA